MTLIQFCVDDTDPTLCWPWNGAIDGDGYGRVWDTANNRNALAHRVMFQISNGDIPDGMVLDHTCHDGDCRGGVACPHRRCVNPAHLAVVTIAENVARRSIVDERYCKRGHDRTLPGGVVAGTRNKCAVCQRENQARHYREHKADYMERNRRRRDGVAS